MPDLEIPIGKDEQEPEANTNCLEGMKCPACGSREPFRIQMTSIFTIYDDGTDEYGDTEWDDESYCDCVACEHSGTVRDFREENQGGE